jgi:hypothetical protein
MLFMEHVQVLIPLRGPERVRRFDGSFAVSYTEAPAEPGDCLDHPDVVIDVRDVAEEAVSQPVKVGTAAT